MRELLASLAIGVSMILMAAILWLVFSPPVTAAGCVGKMVQASWYGMESCVNKSNCRTANGERYTGNDMTAAHRSLPFGTRVKVTYKGKSVTVRISDRGPAKWTKRDLDSVSYTHLTLPTNREV